MIVDYPQSAIIYDARQLKRNPTGGESWSGFVGSSLDPSRVGSRCQFGTIAGEVVLGPGSSISRARSCVGSGSGSGSLTRVGPGAAGSHYPAVARLSRVRGHIFWCSCKIKGGGIAPALSLMPSLF